MDNTERTICYFVRHGETQANGEGLFRGTKEEWPLTDKGIQDAHDVKDFLKDKPIGDSWTSSKKRAEDTAEIVLGPRGQVASPTDSLHPLDVGYLSGEKKSEHQADINYFQRHQDVKIPGGQSIQEFRSQVKPSILLAIRRGVENDAPSAVFAHASIIHEVGNLVHGDHSSALVEPGGVTAVTYDGKFFRAKAVFKGKTLDKKDSTLAQEGKWKVNQK